MTRKTFAFGMAAGVVAASAGLASAGPDGDVGLLLRNGRIVTAVANDETGVFTDIGERVFGADIDPVSNLADDPGFFTTDGPTVPSGFLSFSPGSTITYTTSGALTAWNGSEFVGTSQRLRQIVVPNVLEILTPTDGSEVGGFEYDYNGGDFDEHPDYAMADAGELGIFLWKLSFSAFDANGNLVGESLAINIVFNFGLSEEEHDAAIAFAEATIPAPGVLAVLGGAGLVATRRRR